MLINDLYTNKTPAVAENALNEFAPSDGGGDSGNYFQALASAWYNGTFDSGSLQKGIKSQQDVERLLQRGIVCPDGVTRKFTIDLGGNFDRVVIYSDDYYEHADHDETDSRTGKPFGPYDYMEFSDDELDEGVAEANNDTGVKWFDFATWVLKQGNKYKDFTTNHTVHQAAQKEYKAYVDSRKQGVSEGTDPVTHRIGLTVTDPNHPMVSKRKEAYQKSVRVTGHDKEKAINSAIAHHKRKGYQVHDHHYLGTVDDEPLAEVSLGDYRKKATVNKAMAQTNKFFGRDDAAKVAAADQTIARRERGLARADARTRPYTPPVSAPADLEKQQRDLTAKYPNIDELVRRAELNRDPDYEMADGQAYYAARDAEQNYLKLKQIQRVIQGLNESLDQSHLP